MAQYSNLYAAQQLQRFAPTDIHEMKNMVAIHILMRNLHYPRIRCYWSTKHSIRIPIIAHNMSLNRFFKLRQNLHFADTNARKEDSTDRFWKIGPLYNRIRATCLSLPLEKELCVDEQMGRLNVKQYVKNKPKPWGIKILALCGRSGILLDFILYQGATTELDEMEKEVLGLAGAVVSKLSQRIAEKNVQLFFDNYFSNYNLLQHLRNKGIYATCTARNHHSRMIKL